ncbi:hypothetical protein [Kordiimonas lacus]|uniref:hypothetical protein n=1 Tax=Kordiimonas lacus TaxID=637679 RepID=UPI0019D32356|nr:hypothetical protein [Kordiimonas lacus]
MNISKNTALLLIDWQQGFDKTTHWGTERNNPHAEERAQMLLSFWRATKKPIFHIIHDSLESDSPLKVGRPGGPFQKRPGTLCRRVRHQEKRQQRFYRNAIGEIPEQTWNQAIGH